MFLTADAFGVLPPISRLTREQAAYHFISGYTAKLAGTEVGVKEPTATFSAGLRRAVPAAPPGRVRADARWTASSAFDVPVWLVNTGWTGGPYGTGERMNIDHTRNMVRAAINGELDGVETVDRPDVPGRGPGQRPGRARRRAPVPRATWADPDAYDAAARKLAAMFHENFAQYADGVSEAVRDAGPIEVHEDHGDIGMSAAGRGLTGALHATGN